MRVLAHLISHNKGWMAEQFECGIRLSLRQLINAIEVTRGYARAMPQCRLTSVEGERFFPRTSISAFNFIEIYSIAPSCRGTVHKFNVDLRQDCILVALTGQKCWVRLSFPLVDDTSPIDKIQFTNAAGYNSSRVTVAVVSISQNTNIHLPSAALRPARATCIHLA